jgi:NADPH:quinone reductase
MISQDQTMRTMAIQAFGGPEQLQILRLPLPQPRANQVRVRIQAIGVNPIDLGTREGRVVALENAHFPMVLGWDFAGEVDLIGTDASAWSLGDRVIGYIKQPITGIGTYAEYTVVDADTLALSPDGVDTAAASVLPLAGVTAWQALSPLNLKPGQTFLVNNPLGAVGGFAAQIAAERGAHVIAPAPEDALDVTKSLGVQTVLHGNTDLNVQVRAVWPDGVDAGLDVLGGTRASATWGAVRNGGRYTTTLPEWWAPGGVYTSQRGITPVVVENQPNGADLAQLSALVSRGVLTLRVDRVLDLEQAAQAHRLTGAPGLRGKIVLAP